MLIKSDFLKFLENAVHSDSDFPMKSIYFPLFFFPFGFNLPEDVLWQKQP